MKPKFPNKGFFVFEKNLPPEALPHLKNNLEPLELPICIKKEKFYNAEKQGLKFEFGLRWDIYGAFREGHEISTDNKIRHY